MALARMLTVSGNEVQVWSAIEAEVDNLSTTRVHPNLPGMKIPAELQFTKSIEEVCTGKDVLLFAVPSVFVRGTTAKARPYIPDGQILVDVAKGMEPDTLYTMTEVIAQALGGEVMKSTKGWGLGVSVHAMQTTKPWMAPGLDTIRILASHQDQVEQLPPGATLLAGNDFCPNFMFLQGDHIVAIQGHPEFSVAYNRALIERRRDRLPDAHYQSSLSSLEGEVDSATMMQWLLQFLGILPIGADAR
jgi:hypothetical protein